MKMIKRIFAKIYHGRDGHSDHGSAPADKWFRLDFTPLDSGYKLIS